MKIIGFVYYQGQSEMVLKGDSSMLNGRKPLFIPDWSKEIGATPCRILRVSRLGKEIAPRFAGRYYDAVAPGMDFVAMDRLREAQARRGSWTQSIGFDFSLAIGQWVAKEEQIEWQMGGERPAETCEWLMSDEEAIAQASRWMTIRQGDLIYITMRCKPQHVQPEQILRATLNGEEKLYCKIK